MKVILATLLTATLVISSLPAHSQDSERLVHGRWLGTLGATGLRRSLANGSDLGDLINRTTSYKMAAQVKALRERQAAAGAPVAPEDYDSVTDAWVAQTDSLLPLSEFSNRNLLLRVAARRAARYEDERVDAIADRLELGLFGAHKNGYLGASLMLEQSAAELGFVKGDRDAEGSGLRLDFGQVLGQTWALSGRFEHAWWEGDGRTFVPSPAGSLVVYQDQEFERSYLNLEFIGRYPMDFAFSSNGQLQWRSGLHYLRNSNASIINSLGQPVREPFGSVERLGLLRSGLYYSWRMAQSPQWSPFAEVTYDYEFANNMDSVIDDPHTLAAKLGLARLIKAGWRAQLDLQRYQSLRGERVRKGATLALVFDF